MRVLQLSKFYPPTNGGIESVVYTLTEGLNQRHVHTDVLCAQETRHHSVETLPAGYTVTRTASYGKLLSTSLSPALVGKLRRCADHYDVIHVHLPDPLTNLALWMNQPRARIVVHWHSDVVNQKWALRVYAPLQEWLLRRADAIVATSQAYVEASPWLQAHRHKVHVVPIGIPQPDSQAKPQDIERIRQRFGHRRLVFALGRMVYYKGFEVLVDAARHLPEDVAVVIGGSGPLLPVLQERATAAGLQDRVHFVGRIPQEEIEHFFAAADLFCLPSTFRSEAFGVVLLEAMAQGKPVVATRIPGSGVPWVNEHGATGLNVPVCDDKALAAGIVTVLQTPGLAERFGQAGRERYLRHFTANGMVDGILGLYAELLSPGQAPRVA